MKNVSIITHHLNAIVFIIDIYNSHLKNNTKFQLFQIESQRSNSELTFQKVKLIEKCISQCLFFVRLGAHLMLVPLIIVFVNRSIFYLSKVLNKIHCKKTWIRSCIKNHHSCLLQRETCDRIVYGTMEGNASLSNESQAVDLWVNST